MAIRTVRTMHIIPFEINSRVIRCALLRNAAFKMRPEIIFARQIQIRIRGHPKGSLVQSILLMANGWDIGKRGVDVGQHRNDRPDK